MIEATLANRDRRPSYIDKLVAEVPSRWGVLSLRHALKYCANGITADQIDESDSTVPVTRIETISGGGFSLDRLGHISWDNADQRKRLRRGDILFSNINSLNIIGNCAIFEADAEIYAGMNLLLLRAAESFDSKFLFYALRNPYFRRHVECLAKPAINQASISQASLLTIKIPFPPVREQQCIARYLDRETSKIDLLIQRQGRLVELFNERILAEAGGKSVFKNSSWMRLAHASQVISRPVLQSPDASYTKLGLFNRGRGIFKREETEADEMGDSDFFWVKEGDLILSGQFAWEGAVALAEREHEGCVVSHRFPILRGKCAVANTEYILALLLTSYGDFILNENSRGAAGRNRPLNLASLLKEKIPIASKEVQIRVKSLIQQRRELKKLVDRQIALLQERRASLIQEAVSGKIDVRGLA